MIGMLSRAFDNLLGRGEAAVTVPPLDGAFRPNRALDEAPSRIALPQVDGLALHGGALVASAGDTVYALAPDGNWRARTVHGATVVCIASAGSDGLAIAFDSGEVMIEGGRFGGRRYRADAAVRCITAIAVSEDALYIANGSATTAPADWQRDLLDRNASGSLWRVDLESGASTRIADGLAWPAGIALDQLGIVVSEAWKHRLVRIDPRGRIDREVLADLPGYPGRLSLSAGGWWLALFAPRSQLVEFVLREPAYRRRMMAEVPQPFWVAPKLKSGRSYYEPLQGGGVKHLGMLKPWAPTMSFGMCVRLDAAFQPRLSLQSRADGATHGVTSVIEHEGEIFAVARGDGVVVRMPLPGTAGGAA